MHVEGQGGVYSLDETGLEKVQKCTVEELSLIELENVDAPAEKSVASLN